MSTSPPASSVSLLFGALAEPIGKQLKAQGRPVNRARAKAFQDIADAVTLLKIHGYMPDGQADKARRKLLKRICALAAK